MTPPGVNGVPAPSARPSSPAPFGTRRSSAAARGVQPRGSGSGRPWPESGVRRTPRSDGDTSAFAAKSTLAFEPAGPAKEPPAPGTRSAAACGASGVSRLPNGTAPTDGSSASRRTLRV